MARNRHLTGIKGVMLIAAAVFILLPHLAAAEEAYIIEMENYTLREAPNTTAKAIGRVKVGEKVLVVGRSTGWVRVEIGDRSGWLVESGVGNEPPASARLGPVQERLTLAESRLQELEREKTALQEENSRLSSQAGDLQRSLDAAKKATADAKTSGRFNEIALGGGLIIFGWLTGYALAVSSRRRGGSTRYHIE